MSDPRHVVVVGGSAAGVSAVEAMVERPDRPRITLISADERLPYKRTKVSKSFAEGFERDAFALHEGAWYGEHGVELLPGRTVRRLHPGDHTLELDDGGRLSWSRLILATGSGARRPALAPGVRVHHAHEIDQVEALRAHALEAQTALVVGMGVLGVEVSEQLARMGLRVTLAGDSARLMPEQLDEAAAELLARTLTDHGVELLPGECVRSVEHNPAGCHAVQFAAAPPMEVDLVVFCVGSVVRAELARAAGLRVERGVVVDHRLRTSHPEVFAAGDVAQHPDGRVTHLWRHALHQGRVAGRNALGAEETYPFRPFRLKCKIFGHYFFSLGYPTAGDAATCEDVVLRDGERYLRALYRDGAVVGVVMCNHEAEQQAYNRAVVEGWDRARVEATWRRT